MMFKPKFSLSFLVLLALSLVLILETHYASFLHTSNSDRRVSQQNNPSVALELYNDFLNATESSRGLLHVRLRPATQRTNGTRTGQSAVWRVMQDTTVHASFDLRNGRWERLVLDFGNHPLTVTLAVDTPIPGTFRVGKITYGRDGRVRDVFEPGANSPMTEFVRNAQAHADPIDFFTEALSQLKIPPQIVTLLTDKNLNTGPLKFDSVELLDSTQDNLQLDLAPNTKLRLGIRGSEGCELDTLTLRDRVAVSFTELSYKPSAKSITAATGPFVATLSDACLASGKTALKIAPGSRIDLSQMRFGEGVDRSFLLLQAGRFDGTLVGGSSLVLTQTGVRNSIIKLVDSASLKASGVRFETMSQGRKTLSLASADVTAANISGELAPNGDNHVTFKAPSTSIRFAQADWPSDGPPRTRGDLSDMQVEITGGQFVFNSANKVLIQSARARTSQLAFDTSQTVPLFGAIVPSSLTLERGSVIGSNGRFELQTDGGSLINSAANCIEFFKETPGLKGRLDLLVPNTRGRVDFGNENGFLVNSGNIQAILENGEQMFRGEIKGRLVLGTGRVPIGRGASAGVRDGMLDFDKLTFSASTGPSGPLSTVSLRLNDSETSLSPTFRFHPTGNSVIDSERSGPRPQITDVGVTGPLRINGSFGQGRSGFGGDNFFQLGAGTITGTLAAGGDAPTGADVTLATEVSGGTVRLDSATTLTLASGSRIVTDSLTLNPDGSLAGSIRTAHFQLQVGSLLIAARGRKVTVGRNSTYDETEGRPLIFTLGQPSPSGEGKLNAAFSSLLYADNPNVSLSDGAVVASLVVRAPNPLEWRLLAISGTQIGSYSSITEMPDDEYAVVSRSSSGAIETISAPNRVMVVSTVPIAVNTNANFTASGRLSRAILSRDETVFGIPLAAGSAVEIDADRSMVLVGTIGRDTTIDGIPYSKGCLAHLPPTQQDRLVPPCELITSLAFRIKTSNDIFAGAYAPLTNVTSLDDLLRETKDDIWIDIGPQAWRIPFDSNLSGNMRISGDFHRGETATVEILNPAIGEGGVCSGLDGPDVPLYVGDIRGLRLEKKGIFIPNICGLAEGPDTLMDVVPNPLEPPRPGDILRNLNAAIQLKRQTLAAKQLALRTAQNKLRDLQPQIDEAQRKINEFLENRNHLRDFQNSLTEKQRKVGEFACNHLLCPPLACAPVPTCCPPKVEIKCIEPPCPLKATCKTLNDEIADLQIKINNIQSWLQIHAAEETLALAVMLAKKTLEAEILLVEGQIRLFNTVINAVQPLADELQNLIDHLIPGISVPTPGEWKPETVTIIVNGRDLASFTINERLKQGHSYFEGKIRPMSGAEYFVQGLRVNIVKGDGSDDYMSFIATPAAKMRGFTGWDIITDVRRVEAVGVLRHPFGFGLDAGVSFDLELKQILADGQPFTLDGTKGIRHKRFIRVEYRYGTDQRFRDWRVGDVIRVKGEIKRDRDRTTFYEIHTRDAADIERISP